MDLDTIITAVVAAAPSITAIGGIIVAIVKICRSGRDTSSTIINKFNEMEQKVLDTREYEDLKDQLYAAHRENRELKKKLNELLTKIDKIAREE